MRNIINPIVRDSSQDNLYIGKRSSSDNYPSLKLNNNTIDFISSDNTLLNSIEKYKDKSFDKFITSGILKSILDYMYTNNMKVKISERLKVNINLLRTVVYKNNLPSYYIKPLTYRLPESFVYQRYKTMYDEYRDIKKILYSRKVKKVNSSLKIVDSDKSYTEDADKNSVYGGEEGIPKTTKLVQEMNYFWEKLDESLLGKESVVIDTSITMGSAVPIFSSIPVSGEYDTLSGTLYISSLSGVISKDYFSLKSSETVGTLPTKKYQVIWSSPKTKHSMVKVLWDSNFISSVKLTNLKLLKE